MADSDRIIVPFSPAGGELVIAVVAPTGTDVDSVCREIELALRRVHYDTEFIRLTDGLKSISSAPWHPIPDSPEEDRIKALMDAGDEFCVSVGRRDAVALLGVADLNKRRGSILESKDRRAFLIRSLKRPAEVRTLRQIYGPWFVLIGAVSLKEKYKELLKGRIRSSNPLMSNQEIEKRAIDLIERDEKGGSSSSQNLSATFHLSDAFVDASSDEQLQLTTQRVIDLLFGDRYITPTQDEYGMFHAHASALRSSAPSRQVGAALTGIDGEVISMGTNEVPKAGGGFVWEGEVGDFRDHKLSEGKDPSLLRRRSLVADVLTSLMDWFEEDKKEIVRTDLDRAVTEAWSSVLNKSQILDLIEFQRAQHAEAASLADAARRGIPVKGSTLFTTTYPCHLCAKEIVGSGVKRVVFLEPYPKSRATDFYPESIKHAPPSANSDSTHVSFQAFVGIAPRRYQELFAAERAERVTEDGVIVDFEEHRTTVRPRLGQPREEEPSYLAILPKETVVAKWILDRVEDLYGEESSGST